MNLKIGHTVWVKRIDRIQNKDLVHEAVVSWIGRKYFTLRGDMWRATRFHVDSLTHDGGDYSPKWQVYLSKQEMEDEAELNSKYNRIWQFFRESYRPNITLDQARKITELLNI